MKKVIVETIAKFDIEGKITPIMIVWEDGNKYEIDKVTDTCRRASLKSGGIGIRYTCYIRNKRIYLFKEDDTWFLEKAQ